MKWLKSWANDLGVRFERKHLDSISATPNLPELDFVVNCAGLGARHLVRDRLVYPVRGQLLFLDDISELSPERQIPAIGLDQYCLIPRVSDIGLGSLLEPENLWDPPLHTSQRRAKRRLRRALSPLLQLAGMDRSELEFTGKRVVGLRPARKTGIRLETTRISGTTVIHNYGHGGGGVSLAWGCANKVLQLAVPESRSI